MTQDSSTQDLLHYKPIAYWLFACCFMVFSMVVLGGLTRLTGSGLSMVEWDPVFGVVPPLSQSRWEEIFNQYKQSPEFKKVNKHLDVEGFKDIYWLEFLHRILGRLIGIVFFVPFLFFWLKKKIHPRLVPKLIILFILGGLQGLLGWYMVKSGLVDNPHVSQYRLTAHLLMAFVIYAAMLWVACGIYFKQNKTIAARISTLKVMTTLLLGLIFITIASGGFVAGLRAGYAFNTFPLMGGHWVPEAMFYLEPVWLNFFENIPTVQFDHRLLAMTTLLLVVIFWIMAQKIELSQRAKRAIHLLAIMTITQVILGISTLLLYIPISLASVHQAGAMILFTIVLFVFFELKTNHQ